VTSGPPNLVKFSRKRIFEVIKRTAKMREIASGTLATSESREVQSETHFFRSSECWVCAAGCSGQLVCHSNPQIKLCAGRNPAGAPRGILK
jgi:hypothetical protein